MKRKIDHHKQMSNNANANDSSYKDEDSEWFSSLDDNTLLLKPPQYSFEPIKKTVEAEEKNIGTDETATDFLNILLSGNKKTKRENKKDAPKEESKTNDPLQYAIEVGKTHAKKIMDGDRSIFPEIRETIGKLNGEEKKAYIIIIKDALEEVRNKKKLEGSSDSEALSSKDKVETNESIKKAEEVGRRHAQIIHEGGKSGIKDEIRETIGKLNGEEKKAYIIIIKDALEEVRNKKKLEKSSDSEALSSKDKVETNESIKKAEKVGRRHAQIIHEGGKSGIKDEIRETIGKLNGEEKKAYIVIIKDALEEVRNKKKLKDQEIQKH